MSKQLKDYVWTAEKLAARNIKELKLVRERATLKGDQELVSLCDAEISRKEPPRKISLITNNRGRPVKGIHLICMAEQGVTHDEDGTFWSGSWVIAKEHADAGIMLKTYVALHEKQSEPSYLQGIIKHWRPSARERIYGDKERQSDWGIEFQLEPIAEPFPWRGDGIFEKSYWYGGNEP